MPKKTPKMMMSSSALAKKAESARISEKQKQDIQARVTGKKPKGTIPVKKKGM
jgi:hypothetical protein